MTPPKLAGGTFTVSNLGMFGMTAIYPVINIPQAAILGVGKTRALPERDKHGEIADVSLMTLTLSYDRRILSQEVGGSNHDMSTQGREWPVSPRVG